jgi:DNA-binding NarL/FixJ family response regulator
MGDDLTMSQESPGDQLWCPVCDAVPVVLVALRHPVMRRWTEELLVAEHGCWDVATMADDELLVDALSRVRPDLVVVDSRDFPSCCRAALDRMPPERVMVVGPEPDSAYRTSALSNGAAGWVCRDHVADELSGGMRAALGCRHSPCPPQRSQRRRTGPDLTATRS